MGVPTLYVSWQRMRIHCQKIIPRCSARQLVRSSSRLFTDTGPSVHPFRDQGQRYEHSWQVLIREQTTEERQEPGRDDEPLNTDDAGRGLPRLCIAHRSWISDGPSQHRITAWLLTWHHSVCTTVCHQRPPRLQRVVKKKACNKIMWRCQ